MPAVVRVKRRIDEEPLSAFVLNTKRRRVDDNDEAAVEAANNSGDNASGLTGNKDELSTLLKFAGTISEQDDSATTQFARLSKEEARELVMRKTRKPANATEKARKEMRKNLHEQRFRVVNCLRTTLEDNDEQNGNAHSSKEVTILDIEKQNTTCEKTVVAETETATISTSKASTSAAAAAAALAEQTPPSSTALNLMPSDSDTGYVYDLYIPDNEQHADYVDLLDENYLSVRPFDDLFYEDRYENGEEEADDDEYDSEDSNQENYVGNDYPDEDDDPDALKDDDNGDDDDVANDLAQDLNQFVFGDDDDDDDGDYNSLPSSEDEAGSFYNAYRDPYVHSIDADEENFCADVDSCVADRYGIAYARYKARILKRNKLKTADDDDYESDPAMRDESDNSSDSCDYDAYYDTVVGEDN